MGIFDKFKKNGTKLVSSYKGDIKGSAVEYSTSEVNGLGDGKGFVTGGGDSINATIAKKGSTLHKEASTLNTPAVNKVLNTKSYTQKYHQTALNPKTPEASKIDEGSASKFIAPSSPSVKGRDINTKNYSTAYSAAKTYQSSFDSYKTIDPSIASKF
jgi:hypothetical protein